MHRVSLRGLTGSLPGSPPEAALRIVTARAGVLGALAFAVLARPAPGQGYLLRLDSRFQAAAYRGVSIDSIPASAVVMGPTGGPTTPDGYAVSCNANGYCTFYRAGPIVHAAPVTTMADLTVWGLGISGFSLHAQGRVAGDLSSGDNWPGTDSHVELFEGYAQYAAERLTVQIGRQTVTSRFGLSGFDGGALTLRDRKRGLDVTGYGGWGLARGIALPVTSPALNPLDDFQPRRRQLVAGASAGWTSARADLRVEYQREVDPEVDYFVSERAGGNVVLRPAPGWSLAGGAEYDLAAGWWGSAEAALRFAPVGGRAAASLAVRRYRPHFDLWTIWGAFSPVPYRAIDAAVAFTPIARLRLRASGERYSYDATGAATPLVPDETSGWRFSWGATYTPAPQWTFDGGYHAEFGPGAASRGFDGAVTFTPGDFLALSIQGSTLDRPLEFRFDPAAQHTYGLQGEYRVSPRLRMQLAASRYVEDRQRPDASAFSWDQLRVSGRIVLLFGGGDAGLGNLPPAVRRLPGGREER